MAEETLENTLLSVFRACIGDLEIGLPAAVEAYDPDAQAVTARPAIGDLPAISGVRVLYPSGGGFGMSWPLKKGDEVWLTFSGRAFRGWLAGEDTPRAQHRFSLGECVAIPASARPIAAADGEAMILGEVDGAQLKIKDGRITFGTSGSDVLSLLDDLLGLLQTATVATSLGPQPLDPAAQAEITNIRAALGLIKG